MDTKIDHLNYMWFFFLFFSFFFTVLFFLSMFSFPRRNQSLSFFCGWGTINLHIGSMIGLLCLLIRCNIFLLYIFYLPLSKEKKNNNIAGMLFQAETPISFADPGPYVLQGQKFILYLRFLFLWGLFMSG